MDRDITSRMDQDQKHNRILHFENGRIYFSRMAERKFFFGLTVIMLALGACFRLGILR